MFGTRAGRWTSRACATARLGVAAALAASVVVLPGSTESVSATGTAGFYDGVVRYSTIVNCASIIFPPMYTESGVAAYTGVYADPDQAIPQVGQTVYMHVVVWGMGNACSGQRIVPDVALPPGVTFDTSEPVLCYYSGSLATPNSTDCPGWSNVVSSPYGGDFMYLSSDTANARTWPLPQGKYMEFRFPITSSTTQVNSTIYSYVKVFDGNDNPIVPVRAPLYVYGGTKFIRYDLPSTYSAVQNTGGGATPYGIESKGQVYTGGANGTLYLEGGSSSGNYTVLWSGGLDGSNVNWELWTDWDGLGLVPGERFYWRLRFVPNSGSPTVGAEQSFVAPSQCGGRWPTVNLGFGERPTSGSDVILGTSSSESITALGGDDVVCAGGGNDTIIGGPGSDRMFGGPGTDTVSYAGWSTGVVVSLATTSPQATGAGLDSVAGMERVIGTGKADRLTGSAGANSLAGTGGNDILDGGGGNDVLDGGAGADTLKGNTGTDTCKGGSGTDTAAGCESVSGIP